MIRTINQAIYESIDAASRESGRGLRRTASQRSVGLGEGCGRFRVCFNIWNLSVCYLAELEVETKAGILDSQRVKYASQADTRLYGSTEG